MIISKTPYRISFFGGGSDYPNWYRKHGGEVLSSTIDKYVYVSCRQLPKFFDHKYRIVYSSIEATKRVEDIKHIVVRNIIKKMKIKKGIELHYDGDLPAQSGMGSSSSFIVGCMNIFLSLQGSRLNKKKLAKKSLDFEQNVLKEIVGSQDQIAAAHGGFNSIKFSKNGSYSVNPLKINKSIKNNLNNRLYLVFTGNQRRAHDIASTYVQRLLTSKMQEMKLIQGYVKKAKEYLKNNKLDDFGDLLDESWKKKKELSKNISSEYIDEIYAKALNSGALGGKILGAGGGGFFLFYVKKDRINNFKRSLKNFIITDFKLENEGSKIVFNNENYEKINSYFTN
jgi:D-glycero-alpha-D-manno-heptose-7-phosphate kinase